LRQLVLEHGLLVAVQCGADAVDLIILFGCVGHWERRRMISSRGKTHSVVSGSKRSSYANRTATGDRLTAMRSTNHHAVTSIVAKLVKRCARHAGVPWTRTRDSEPPGKISMTGASGEHKRESSSGPVRTRRTISVVIASYAAYRITC